jgi:hypothetical protein
MTAEWYVAMGQAMAERTRALNMVRNWQEKADRAEREIDDLTQVKQAAETGNVPFEQEQEQEPQ